MPVPNRTMPPAAAVEAGRGALRTVLLPIAWVKTQKNPRRRFDETKLEELAASIREHGILEPLIVLPSSGAAPGEIASTSAQQLVAGERRLRAARLAGLDHVPVIVRDLSERQAIEVSLVENLQREDLTALEEATAYADLRDRFGYAVDTLAKKAGKSTRYIYARLQLCSLPDEAGDLLAAGRLSASTALIVAQAPKKVQLALAREIAGVDPQTGEVLEDDEGEPMSYRETLRHVRFEHGRDLRRARWPLTDAELFPDAGACDGCDVRTGTDIADSAGVCMRPACYESKGKAWEARELAQAAAAGCKVLKGKAAKAALAEVQSHRGPRARLDDRCDKDPQYRPWRRLLSKKELAQLSIEIVTDRQGPAEIIDRRAALRLLGWRFDWAKPGKGSGGLSASEKRYRESARRATETARRAIAQIVTRVEAENPDEHTERGATNWLIAVIGALECSWADVVKLVARRRGLLKEKIKTPPPELLRKAAAQMPARQLAGLAVELLISRAALSGWQGARDTALGAACKAFRVDPAAIARDVAAEAKAASDRKSRAKPARKSSRGKDAPKAGAKGQTGAGRTRKPRTAKK